jgi:hypothetical protein
MNLRNVILVALQDYTDIFHQILAWFQRLDQQRIREQEAGMLYHRDARSWMYDHVVHVTETDERLRTERIVTVTPKYQGN